MEIKLTFPFKMSDDEMMMAMMMMMMMVMLLEEDRSKERKYWVHPINKKRKRLGEFHIYLLYIIFTNIMQYIKTNL